MGFLRGDEDGGTENSGIQRGRRWKLWMVDDGRNADNRVNLMDGKDKGWG